MAMMNTEEQPRGADHRRALARLRRATLGRASHRELAQLAQHLKWCGLCRETYDRQVEVDRELARLSGAETELVPLERALARAAILETAVEAPRRGRSWRLWVGLSAAVTIALLLLLLLPVLLRDDGPPASKPPEFAVRGADAVALRLYCIDPGAPAGGKFRPASADGGVLGCRLRESLKVTYLNAAEKPGYRYLWVVGLDQELSIKWYYPTPGAPSGVAIKATRELAPLPDMIRLEVNHRPGQVRVFGVFSRSRIDAARIGRALRQVRSARPPLGKIRALPLGKEARQVVVDLRILP
jgi:hypothetical protein